MGGGDEGGGTRAMIEQSVKRWKIVIYLFYLFT